MSAKPKLVPIIVTLTDAAMPQFASFQDQLKKHGMEIDFPIEILGQFAGKLSESQISAVAKLEGVKAVEVQGEVYVQPFPTDS